MLCDMNTTPLSPDVFRAVSDPTRRQILDLLIATERSVTEIRGSFSMSQPAISQHLRVLKNAGLVAERKDGRKRIYRLQAEPLQAVFDWAAHYQQFWTERLDALGDYLDRDETNGGSS